MQLWSRFPRALLLIALLIGLLGGMLAPTLANEPVKNVKAAPIMQPLMACPASTIAQWTFSNTVIPSTGNGQFLSGSGITPLVPPGTYTFLAGTSIYFSSWDTGAALNPNDYLEFQVDTSGYYAIKFDFSYRATGAGPLTLEVHYSTDGTSNFTYFSTVTPLTRDSAFHALSFDLSSISALDNNPNAKFRIYAYGGGAGNFGVDDVTISDICIPPSADLSLTQTVDNATPNLGSNVVFTITVTNGGPDDATNVTVKDLLPTGLTFVSPYTASTGTYDSASGIWTVGTLTNGASATLEITATVATAGAKTNWAEVWSADQVDPDSVAGNGSTTEDDDDSRTVNPVTLTADLSLTQAVSDASPDVGDNVVFTITVSNSNTTGFVSATNVEVKDLLPTGFTFVSYSDAGGGTYDKTTGIWKVGTLANGASRTLNITATVGANATQPNWAEVSKSDQYDPDSTPGNISTITTEDDGASAPFSVDLGITKMVNNLIPIVGNNVVFTIIVSNISPYAATNVELTDLLPAALTYISDNSSGAYVSSTGIWRVGTVAGGASKVLKITAIVIATVPMSNSAAISKSDQPDPIPTNNTASVTVTPPPTADLSITKTVGSEIPNIGNDVTFTITVKNGGPDPATNVQVKDLLPLSLTFVSYSSTIGTYNKSTGIWLVGALADGANETLTVTATVTKTTSAAVPNMAEVWKSDQIDPDSTPGNASTKAEDDDDSVSLAADLSVTMTASTTTPLIGTKVVFTITVSNGGPYTATNVAVKDLLPASLTYVSDTGGGAYVSSTGIWTVGTLTKGVSKTLKITATAKTAATTTNWAEVWKSDQLDDDSVPGNNSTTTDDDDSITINSKVPTPTRTPTRTRTPTLTRTPTRIPTHPPQGRMIINEFLPRPGFDWNQDGQINVKDEFIEIKNLGPVDITLNNWKLDDALNQGSAPFTIPSMTVKPGQRVVFYGSTTGILLSDGGDTVRLLNSANKVIDAYTYAVANVADRSWCRFPDSPNNIYWHKNCLPTPGLPNELVGEVPSGPPTTGLEVPLCPLPDTLLPDYLLAECGTSFGGGIWRPMYWDKDGWLDQYPVYDDKSKWASFVE